MLRTEKWDAIASRHSTPEQRAKSKAAARAELDRIGYGNLRKARNMTQTDLAGKLGVSQPSIAALEQRSDIMLSTLAKYIEALGGRLDISAVFPNGSFSLSPPASPFHEGFAHTAVPKAPQRRIAASPKKMRGRKVA